MIVDPFVDVGIEHQTVLMQLMAKENIAVEVKHTSTAYFNPKKRVVTLPHKLFFLSKDIADLFSTHEIAHALFSPVQFSDIIKDAAKDFQPNKKKKFFVSSVMVFEDERIERLIKAEFKGLYPIFYRAYKDLFYEKDFFKMKDRVENGFIEVDLLTRANLFFKAGESVHVEFTQHEQDEIQKALNNRTFEDVISFCKKFTEMFYGNDKISGVDLTSEDSENANNQESDDQGFNERELQEQESGEQEQEQESGDQELGDNIDYQHHTDFDDFLDDIKEQQIISVKLPDPKFSKHLIISSKVLTESRVKHTKLKTVNKKKIDQIRSNARIMANEFQSKKAALQFSKMKVSNLGDINTNRLSQYRISDDIFKTKEIVNNVQSHGIVVFVDYSGSMQNIIGAVRSQMLQIAEFCNLTNIPFEIFAFSDAQLARKTVETNIRQSKNLKGLAYQEHFRSHALLNLLSSKMTRSEYKKSFDSLSKMISPSSTRYDSWKDMESLSQTPLSRTKFDSIGIVQDFKKENPGLQKVHCIFITDGATSSRILPYIPLNGTNTSNLSVEIGDKTLAFKFPGNKTSSHQFGYTALPDDYFLYHLFKKNHPNVNLINLFLTNETIEFKHYRKANSNQFLNSPDSNKATFYEKEFTKFGIVKIEENDIFDSEFVINSNIVNNTRFGSIFDNSKMTYTNSEDLLVDFEDSLVSKKQQNIIARKIAEFLS
jgi:hypothetical protein